MLNYASQVQQDILIAGVATKHYDNKTFQLVQDWDTVPFVSLKVVSANESCPQDHPDVMIYREFQGIKDFCVCRGRDISGHKDSYYEVFKLGNCASDSKPKCKDEIGLPAVK